MNRRLKRGAARSILLATCLMLNAQQTVPAIEVMKKISKGVVLIKGRTATSEVGGSGFIVSSDGKIATNLHVIQDMTTGAVHLPSGEVFDSISVVAFDVRRDLAIVVVPGFDLPVVQLANSNNVEVGEQVFALGSPMGLEGTITSGIVSSIRDDPFQPGSKVIQTDAAINPGNSGGPLVNTRGEVIGVVTMKRKGAESLGFAVPINYVRGMLSNLRSPVSLDLMRSEFSQAIVAMTQSSRPEVSPVFPALWKSLVSATKRKITVDGGRISYEGILAQAYANNGGYVLGDLKKQGDKFVGVDRRGIPCLFNLNTETKLCRFESQVEMTMVEPTRIEGRIMAPAQDSKLNCRKCEYSKAAAWLTFAWIPD